MGREVKRVALNFKWFEQGRKVWFGYILPTITCKLCINGYDGKCPLCEDLKYVYVRVEPPKGEGYQVWEDVSEGSPISPVFKTKEELAKYMTDNTKENDVNYGATYEDWLTFIKVKYAPSFHYVNGTFKGGVIRK